MTKACAGRVVNCGANRTGPLARRSIISAFDVARLERRRHPAALRAACARHMFAEAVLVELGQTRNLGSAAEREVSERIQSARGLACILLVSFHVIGNEPTTGLHVPQDSGLNFFAHLFSYIRMPLFSFLSGFVYAYRPVRESQGLQLAASKLRRLMIPMITAVTATYVLTLLHERHSAEIPSSFGAALGQLLPLYIYPYKHFWFLQALFLVF